MIKEKLKKAAIAARGHAARAYLGASAFIASTVTANADPPATGGLGDITTTNNGSDMMKKTIGQVLILARYAGILLLVIGLIMLFTGFKNEDAEAKHRAGLVVIAGIGLVSIKTIVDVVTGSSVYS